MRLRAHRHPLARPGTSVSALLGLLVAMSALAGCSGDDSAKSSSTSPRATQSVGASPSGSSASGSPSPSATPGPPKAPHTAKDTAAARKAFASFVVARWGYALRTNDASVVTGLSPHGHPCQGCKDLAGELAKRRKQHWYVDFPGAKVRSVTVAAPQGPGPVPPHTYLARAKVDIPASQSLFKDGSFRNDNPAHRGATFEVQMSYAKKTYALLSFRVL